MMAPVNDSSESLFTLQRSRHGQQPPVGYHPHRTDTTKAIRLRAHCAKGITSLSCQLESRGIELVDAVGHANDAAADHGARWLCPKLL